MKANTIHHLNSGLIILSCLIAFFIPFELFLFSYAVLGPLHYLTEIGWLHKKNYFTKGKYDFVFLVIACVLLVYWNYRPPKDYTLIADLMLFALLISIAFVFIKDWLYRFVIFALALISISFLNNASYFYTFIGVFLPTVIHVFVFTWAFMLYGILKEKSTAGFVSIGVLTVSAIVMFAFQPNGFQYEVSSYIKNSYNAFAELNFRLVNALSMDKFTELKDIFTSNAGFVIMRFIAFAYTYHYLNWFSKTSVIKWHQVSKQSLIFTISLWLLSVGLYAYDYNLGLKVLFFLSFLHVLLEFPLNVVSFTGIGKEVVGLVKR
jgi:hypothetical protein